MELEKQKVLLYDFLYIDKHKITSLYAQIFGGHLKKIEKTSESQKISTREYSLGVGIAKSKFGFNDSVGEEKKETIEPHDILTIDVLSYLVENHKNFDDLIILKNGKVIFINEFSIKILTKSMDLFLSVISHDKTIDKKDRKAVKNILELLSKFLETAPISPVFLYQNENKLYGGTINENYLSEPIMSYYLKHGTSWIIDISLIGFLEKTSNDIILNDEHILTSTSEIYNAFSTLIFPENTKKIIPLALLKKLNSD